MKCPSCKSEMIILEFNEIEVDYCTECSGIWLDSGELELMADDERQRELLVSSIKKAENCGEELVHCPRCNKKMEKISFGENNDVLLDKCVRNCGLWFDKGELHDVLSLHDQNNVVAKQLKEMFVFDSKNQNTHNL